MPRDMTIGRAADKAGVGVETIRFYERRGLITQPARPRDGGYRAYDAQTIERIRFIRQGQELGFSLREIAELLDLKADPQADCADVRAQAIAKRHEVNHKIGQLERIRSALDTLIASCPGGGGLRACSIMDALSEHEVRDAHLAKTPRRRSLARKDSGMQGAVFKIEGMFCGGCARTVEALLRAEPGVESVLVSFDVRQARVSFDRAVTGVDRLTQAIARAGYSVREHMLS